MIVSQVAAGGGPGARGPDVSPAGKGLRGTQPEIPSKPLAGSLTLLTFLGHSSRMELNRARVAAAAALCAAAGAVALWSGPLAAASGALHSGATAPSPHIAAPHPAGGDTRGHGTTHQGS